MKYIFLFLLLPFFASAQIDSLVEGQYNFITTDNIYPKMITYMDGPYFWRDSLTDKVVTDSLLTIAIAFTSVHQLHLNHKLPLPVEENQPNWVIVRYAVLSKDGQILQILDPKKVRLLITEK